MSEHQKHGADVHVPTDTEGFEKTVEENGVSLTPELIAIRAKMVEISQRFTAYTKFVSNSPNAGPLTLLFQSFIQMKFNTANQNAFNALVMDRLSMLDKKLLQTPNATGPFEITTTDIVKAQHKLLEDELFEIQATQQIIITPREVIPMPRD